ncbi:DUF2244 domain-containing protein [Alteraurantiacibacter buctensis]|uniref:Uncharacterized protein n=1 Tax=Alteraurantiacibacter buctensis TaxID=1503981 RepID=A0A844Z1M1_9SPHN|nr:DUF2244 domain-containing protein [Alteraurantiacibacter buctensis]MXO73402.1 hypothetical protein [Alteraurantiacibacter buctensis]
MTDRPNKMLTGWRIAGWGALAALLALPAIAMRMTPEVYWTGSDFLFAGVLLGVLGAGTELAIVVGRSAPHKVGIAIAVLALFLTVWINGAVGMLGSEDEPTNLAFIGMALAGVTVGLALRFRPAAMRWVMGGISVGQFAVGLVAMLWTMPGHAVEWGVLAFFALIWGASAWCFRLAAARGRLEPRVTAG